MYAGTEGEPERYYSVTRSDTEAENQPTRGKLLIAEFTRPHLQESMDDAAVFNVLRLRIFVGFLRSIRLYIDIYE